MTVATFQALEVALALAKLRLAYQVALVVALVMAIAVEALEPQTKVLLVVELAAFRLAAVAVELVQSEKVQPNTPGDLEAVLVSDGPLMPQP
tara:strand:+ start:354 stop:629 length:276 start_codon:yes stop_codon:yes gene_type:complete